MRMIIKSYENIKIIINSKQNQLKMGNKKNNKDVNKENLSRKCEAGEKRRVNTNVCVI